MGRGQLIAGDAPLLHPVFHRLALREVQAVFVDETALVFKAGQRNAALVLEVGWNVPAIFGQFLQHGLVQGDVLFGRTIGTDLNIEFVAKLFAR